MCGYFVCHYGRSHAVCLEASEVRPVVATRAGYLASANGRFRLTPVSTAVRVVWLPPAKLPGQ